MAEVKNSFITSKMNKDLDDRLVPNNQYRDALNIEVGKSETNNIGVLQNMRGNVEVLNSLGLPAETNIDLEPIGIFMDNQNNRIYQFLTDYTDPNPDEINLPPSNKEMKITVYDVSSGSYSTLVEGIFLNFSKTNLVLGVNLVEGLLFWTDNRNQPRKINYNRAINSSTYYTTETQISVAKYAPVAPVSLVKTAKANVVSGSGKTYVLSNINSVACTIGTVTGTSPGPYTATITTAVTNGFFGFLVGDVIAGINGTGSFGIGPVTITSVISSTSIKVFSKNIFSAGTASITLKYPYLSAIQAGATVVSSTLPGSEYAYVMSVSNNTITLYQTPLSTINPGDKLTFLISTMSDKSSDPNWPGDPAYLEDKYVRFSYRFKFDDNEYSLMAPFSQIAYIPRQKGYFISGDETNAYRSTIIKWMENYVNNIDLLITLPDKGSNINNTYKITDVEVLYKESDSLAVKVLDSVSWVTIKNASPDTNIYTYAYQSQKAYKTLNENQTTRVYDLVPTRALSQEISGNRVIYGNFYNGYTPPTNINYNTAVQPKSDIFTNFIEYPNHTLKQNRNYQVGFVLADKFGRQSSVLLSSADLAVVSPGSGVTFGGSTVYAPYQSETAPFPEVRNWFGNALLVLVNDTIKSQRNIPQGTPGLYAESTSPNGFAITTASISGNYYTFTLDATVTGSVKPATGDYLRGAFTDYIKVLNINPTFNPGEWRVETDGQVNDIYLPTIPAPPVDTKFAYTINEIGWYSYKVVVKQQQQDYYNAYLPGMLDGYPSGQTFGSQVIYTGSNAETENSINTTSFPIGESGKTSHIVLINDNINKIPRDLTEVGPDQKQYRSSAQLFGRVENSSTTRKLLGDRPLNNQYATTITYTIVATENAGALKEIKPGDGIQCDEANGQIPNPAHITDPNAPTTIDNPQKWYANTVVVSNELLSYTAELAALAVGGSTTMVLTPSHPVVTIGDTIAYTISGVSYENTVANIVVDTITTGSPIQPVGGIPANTILSFVNPSKGVITFTPPNWTRWQSDVDPPPGAYINFTITKAENIQYYPARKADVVSSIATSTDFNFLENTVDNVKGTAGLNFYQLQTRPLIGRVSTTKSIGVTSDSMIPFLSVYETTPDITSLALFWETTSTGLISDLNSDVLVGFNGPTQFGGLNFRFFEDQDPLGNSNVYGDYNSRYITSDWTILNNTGFPIALDPGTVPTFDLVEDNQTPRVNVTSKFEIVPGVTPNTWRFAIKDSFTFDYNSPKNSKFFFYVKVIKDGISYILQYTNRLGNIRPFFDYNFPAYNRVVDQSATDIVTVTGKNGSFRSSLVPGQVPNDQTDLWWSIISGNNHVPPYFQINNLDGTISLVDPAIPLGTYRLRVRLQDAFNASPPQPLIGTSPYDSKNREVDVDITIGPKPVNDYLQYYDTGLFVWQTASASPFDCGDIPGQGYGAVYIGTENIVLDPVTRTSSSLPNLFNTSWNGVQYPSTGTGAYQSFVNVQVANGADFIVDPPAGLTQGEIQFTVYTNGTGNSDEKRRSIVNWILYFREPNPPNDTWQSILDSNNIGSPNSTIVPFENGVGDNLTLNIIGSSVSATRSTEFVISNPAGVITGEYCLVVWHQYIASLNTIIDPPPLQCGFDFYTGVIVQDANYTYTIDPPSPDPVLAYKYTVQLKDTLNYPVGIPYNTQDATIPFSFSTTGTVAATALVGATQIVLTANNPQIVSGLYIGTPANNRVMDIALDGVTIILETPLSAQVNNGTVLNFGTISGFANTGTVYAVTNNPLHVKQFYTDNTLATLWEPPVPNKFYLFYNTDRNYNNWGVNVPGMSQITNKPLCSAEIGAFGNIIPQTVPDSTTLTGWDVSGPLTNYGRNLSQTTLP